MIASPSHPPHGALPPIRRQRFDAVLNEVSAKHDVPRELILAAKPRYAFVVHARWELAYLLRRRYKWSTTIIAQFTKAADHTVVAYRIAKHCERCKLKLPKGLGIMRPSIVTRDKLVRE